MKYHSYLTVVAASILAGAAMAVSAEQGAPAPIYETPFEFFASGDFDRDQMVPKLLKPSPDPAKRHAVYHAMDLNFRLKPGSKAVDAGVLIPTINDGFTGRAPDLGALEVGAPPPKYGPAWLTWQPFYR